MPVPHPEHDKRSSLRHGTYRRNDEECYLCGEQRQDREHSSGTSRPVAQTARNKFAHNALTVNEETNQVEIGRATARGSLKTTIEKVVPEDISEATAKIHDAMCALHTLVTGHELKPMWERDE